MLDYSLLEALDAVHTERSFRGAARLLHLTQPAVSQRIKLLEDRLGEPLVVRSNPPELTVPGRALIAHLRQVKMMEAELLETPGAARDLPLVRIGTNADSLATWLLDALTPVFAEERILFVIIAE